MIQELWDTGIIQLGVILVITIGVFVVAGLSWPDWAD